MNSLPAVTNKNMESKIEKKLTAKSREEIESIKDNFEVSNIFWKVVLCIPMAPFILFFPFVDLLVPCVILDVRKINAIRKIKVFTLDSG